MRIENLIHSVGNAVQESHKMIELNSIENFFNHYFDEVKNENSNTVTYKPKTVEIMVPGKDDSKSILAPVAALVQHNHMNIDYVKINLNINVTDEKEDKLEVTAENAQSNNSNTDEDRCNTGEIEIMFKCKDSPEGIARIETHLNSIL